ncbi:GGDEF domain-containing protein [Jeotgalibacillus sp. JSM ZJ347]|uniref:GGDEF domain-containing protein n=1 Tax=Jeotgalibacillus sp. JSM ZJ347 TaxID=3342117 RepID=UPI0035A83799
MAGLDSLTLGAVIAVLAFISAGVMTITWRMNLEERGVGMWAAAAIIGGLGFSALTFFPLIGSYATFLNNTGTLIAPLLIFEGILRFRGYGKENVRRGLFIPVIIYIITVSFLNRDDPSTRFLFHDSLSAIIFFGAAFFLLRKTQGVEKKIYFLTAGIFAIIGGSFIIRWVLALSGEFTVNHINHPFTSYLFFIVMIWIVGWTYGLSLAVNYRNHKRMMTLATHDYLTGLPNRKFLNDYIKNLMTSQKEEPFVLYSMDLNGFKQINDLYGHKTGDDVLIKMAESLRDFTWDQHTAVRLGGDEFVIVMKQTIDERAISETKKKIRQVIEEEKMIETGTISLKTSIGHAAYPTDGQTMDDLLIKADAQMYKEKSYRKLASEIHSETYQI